MNLTVNARDAMSKGGKRMIETANVELDEEYARAHPGVAAGTYVTSAVTDTGKGIAPKVKERIFEPFFTTKELGRGMGLGLSTAYGIIKQSGGHIVVESELGHGTTFKVYLPRTQAEKTKTQSRRPAAGVSDCETVLIVEDAKAVRTLTSRILTTAGYKVIATANGGEALLECERRGGEIDLVLTDVVMPHMSGKDLADRLATLCPDLKVLYMSGYTGSVMMEHGILTEGTRFISKPFDAAQLLEKLRLVLEEDLLARLRR